MKKTGELLKQKRESINLSLSEVALATKINPKVLTAIENGDESALPAKTFLKGFVRSYALFLKMDVEEVMRTFTEETGGPAPQPVHEAYQKPAENAPASPRRKKVDEESSAGMRTVAVIVIVILIGLIIGVRELIEKYQKEKVVATEVKVTPLVTPPVQPQPAPKDGSADGEKSADTKADDDDAEDSKAADAKAADAEKTDEKPADPKPAEAKTESAKPAETKVEAKNVEVKVEPVAVKPIQGIPPALMAPKPPPEPLKPAPLPEKKSAESKPEEKPADSKPAEAKAAETKPADAKPVDAKTAETKPADTKPGDQAKPATAEKPADASKLKNEVILEALDKVEVKFSVHGEAKRVSLGPTQVHTIQTDGPLVLDLSDGGAVNIIVNGRERGPAGPLGKAKQVTIP